MRLLQTTGDFHTGTLNLQDLSITTFGSFLHGRVSFDVHNFSGQSLIQLAADGATIQTVLCPSLASNEIVNSSSAMPEFARGLFETENRL